ncbi:hypothetical protein BAUCODRAFT_72098 [Baudoinia panamericana UAMH 10762]|uniref:Succinate dehydrogenase assembly factor 4, mitochondrial n=1 Tax=Baudoinia panamericana (strain UAMH 10762) TaxID=717646 RepID=M2LLP2_BAUPA|nr:uncharacterized protein BAUCODRAFT_72098 [Baudoinia panamericana UAMH 10762]EMC95217.1 hypothetical protein BAUCODRAFT_72098 [Baudoinia panamericana UAMH 10762]
MQSYTTPRIIRAGFFRRPFTTTTAVRSSWTAGPSPPRLPKEEQAIFERLQSQSTGAFSTPRSQDPPQGDAKAEAEDALLGSQTQPRSSEASNMLEELRRRARVNATGEGEELHPDVRRGALPEFEGDINPKTGEVGGPKNEPQRWGATGDWSYNGRVTDF